MKNRMLDQIVKNKKSTESITVLVVAVCSFVVGYISGVLFP